MTWKIFGGILLLRDTCPLSSGGDVHRPGVERCVEATSPSLTPCDQAGDTCRCRVRAALHPRHGRHRHLFYSFTKCSLQDTGDHWQLWWNIVKQLNSWQLWATVLIHKCIMLCDAFNCISGVKGIKVINQESVDGEEWSRRKLVGGYPWDLVHTVMFPPGTSTLVPSY